VRRLRAPERLPFPGPGIAVAQLVLFVVPRDLLIAAVDSLQRDLAPQRLHDLPAVLGESGAVQLQHRERAVEIDHHAGKAVALAVDQPGTVGFLGEHVGAAQRYRFRDAAPPEERAYRFGGIAGQHAHADGADRIVVAARDELAAGDDVHDRPGLQPAWRPFDRA